MTLTLAQAEQGLTLSEASKRFPGRPSVDTIRRWIRKGLRGGIKLEAFRLGGALYLTPAAIDEFIAAQNRPADPTAARRSKSASDELAELGV